MLELTTENYQQEIKEGLVMIDFWADWCEPCKIYGPKFKDASDDAKDVKFAKVDIDKEMDIASSYDVRSIPTTILLKDGEVVDRLIGVREPVTLLSTISKHR